MPGLEGYAVRLRSLLDRVGREGLGPNSPLLASVNAALDGEARAALRASGPTAGVRQRGIFFTSSELAERVAALASMGREQPATVDPACGAGDLLLAIAKTLPLQDDPEGTLESWGRLLAGHDVHRSFVETARLRLVLLALRRHSADEGHVTVPRPNLLPGLSPRDTLKNPECVGEAARVLLNPPYVPMQAPRDCDWSSGRVNAAAVFVWRYLQHMKPGSQLFAILPDVLRSGPRYLKWRVEVAARCEILHLEPAGRFDDRTDVEVFLVHAVAGKTTQDRVEWWAYDLENQEIKGSLSDLFDISVGPVVPHRDEERGPERAYLTARTAPPWSEIRRITLRRQYAGRVARPPFVVIRRTSRPEDEHRAVGCLVLGRRPVAIENHLVVLQPRDGNEATCRQLTRHLKRAEVTKWLNRRSRCHHLTVAALRQLPVPDEGLGPQT